MFVRLYIKGYLLRDCMFLKIVKYLLPIFCFTILSAELDLNLFNEKLSSSVIISLNISGAKGVDQIINLKIGDENKIEVLESQDIVLTDKNIFLSRNELNFRISSLGSIGGYIKYTLTLKELPSNIIVKNRGFLKGRTLDSYYLNIIVKNYSKVTLSGQVDEQFVEIDNTSSYCAEKLETRNTEIFLKNSLYARDDLSNNCVVVDALNSLKIFGSCLDVPVFFKHFPFYLEYKGFFSRVELLTNEIKNQLCMFSE